MGGARPAGRSVASLFVCRWDVAVADPVPAELKDKLALAVGLDAYRAYAEVLDSERATAGGFRRAPAAAAVGEHQHEGPQRPDTLYVGDCRRRHG